MNNTFNLENFNTFSDNENYYFFRALNNADKKDLDDKIILDNNGNIKKIRTNLDRFEKEAMFKVDDEISLNEVVNHIKMHQRKDTKCISLTSNANTAITYGRGNYSDKYVLVRVPKEEMNKTVYNAGAFMIDEISKKIDEILRSNELDEFRESLLKFIDNAKNKEELDSIKEMLPREYISDENYFQNGLDFTNTRNYLSLNDKQNFEKDKIVMKLDVIKRNILKTVNNNLVIGTVGNAFSALEMIHYGEISKEKLIEIPKDLMDIFALLQQVPDNTLNIEDLKKDFLEKVKIIKLKSEYDYSKYIIDNDFSLDKVYELTNGELSYKDTVESYEKIFYLAKSKVRTSNSVKLLNKLVNDPKYNEIYNYIENNTYGIEPNITTRKSIDLINISESTSLNFTKKDQELFDYVNKLSNKNCLYIMNDQDEKIKDIIKLCSVDSLGVENEKELWHANSMIDLLSLNRFGANINLSSHQRRDIVNKLIEVNFLNVYNNYKSLGYSNEKTVNMLFTKLIRESNGNYEKDLFTLEEFENFIGYNKIPNTDLNLRSYQRVALENINRSYQNKNFSSAVLPTGGGKSFVALAQMNMHEKEKIIYLAPSNEILNQIEDYIKIAFNLEEHLGDSKEDIIRRKFPNLELKTYQSLKSGIEENQNYSLIIFDEVHRTGAKEWSKNIESLINNQSESTKVLGISATPERDMDYKNMTNFWALKLGYTKEEVELGKHLAINMDIVEAILSNYVVHPKVVCCIKSLKSDGSIDDIKSVIDNIKSDEEKEKLKKELKVTNSVIEKAPGIEKILSKNLKNDGKYIIFLPVSESIDQSEEDRSDITINIVDDYITLISLYIYIEEYFDKYGSIIDSIYTKLVSKVNLSKEENEYLREEKNNILLLGNFDVTNKVNNLSIDKCRVIDFIIDNQGFVRLTKEEVKKGLREKTKDRIDNYSMLSAYSKNRNQTNLNAFAYNNSNKMKFMFVINKLNEGVHVPDIDGIVWLRKLNQNSKILYLQQLVRCIYSLTPGKMVEEDKRPVVIDLVNNTINVDLEKGLDDVDKDLMTITNLYMMNKNQTSFLKINYSEEQINQINALVKKYKKYLEDDELLNSLDTNRRGKISNILELGVYMDIWNYETFDRVNEFRNPLNRNILSTFKLDSIVVDFINLQKKIYSTDKFESYISLLKKLPKEKRNLSSDDRVKINSDGSINIIKKIDKNYSDETLIKLGSWLYFNQTKFTDEQKNILRNLGYIFSRELEKLSFQKSIMYLEKLPIKNRDLSKMQKIKVSEDGKVTVVKSNEEHYNDKDLIALGKWLNNHQDKFTDEQKEKLRKLGYILSKDIVKLSYEKSIEYLKKLPKKQRDLNSVDKIKQHDDGKIEVILEKDENYKDKKMINLGHWLYVNKVKFTIDEQKKLTSLGYNCFKEKERLNYEKSVMYLEKLLKEDRNLGKSYKIKVCEDGKIEVVLEKDENYYDKNLIGLGQWLYSNQVNFTDEQKENLRKLGYIFSKEIIKLDYEKSIEYLEKLPKEDCNLSKSQKIKVCEDGKVTVVNKNEENYKNKNLIALGSWLYFNQTKFTDEEKENLRNIGYIFSKDIVKLDYEKSIEYLKKIPKEDRNISSESKIKINTDKSVEVINKKNENYKDSNLINLGHWLYIHQKNFTNEQVEELLSLGYKVGTKRLKEYEEAKIKFDENSNFESLKKNMENKNGRGL